MRTITRVDDEGADRGDVILARDVEHAEQQRAEQRAQNAVRAADRDDDQEGDQKLDRKRGVDAADDVGRQRPAEAGEPAADGEGDGEQRSTLMPSPAATRGSSTAARNCAPKRVLDQEKLEGGGDERRRPRR